MNLAIGFLVAAGLIAANAFFVAVEFALVAVDRTRLRLLAEEGSRPARAGVAVLKRLSFHLSGAQLGITITSLALGLLSEPVVARALEPLVGKIVGDASALGVSVVLALLLTTVVQMVVGELVPKSVAVARPLQTTLRYAPAFAAFATVAKPVIWICNASANGLLRLAGVQPTEELSGVRSKEELRRLVRTSSEGGTLKANTAKLLERSFSFGDKTAADALTPRVSIIALGLNATVADLLERSNETGLSRFPIHGGDLDHILGVVHVKEVLALPRETRNQVSLSSLLKPVAMVPETKPLDDLLLELRDTAGHIAVILDEYGGTAGVITIEDLVEEIVGDIADEHDPAGAIPRTRAWRGAHVLSGLQHPDEVADACGFEVPEGKYETLGGFVADRLGKIPTVGDSFHSDGWQLRVVQMDSKRVDKVQLIAPPPVPADADSDSETNGGHP